MKKNKFRSFLIFFTLLTGLVCVSGSLACYISNSFSWPFSIAALAYPFTITILFILVLWLLISRSKWWIGGALCIVLSLNQLLVIVPATLTPKPFTSKAETAVRILSWNVSRWDERNWQLRGGTSFRPLMLDYIESSGAEILCLQEFFECHDPMLFASNTPELKKRGFIYHSFFPASQLFDGKLQYGLAIFSRFPILKTAYLENSKGHHSEGLLYADIALKDTIVRVFNLHLETPGISQSNYTNDGKIKLSYAVFSKIKNSYFLRNKQAEQALVAFKQSPYPNLICADLGDVPNSYAYHTLIQNNQDAFLKKGAGLGTTLRHTSPTLRIDYILASNSLKVLQFDTRNSIRYSDHFPLLADFQVPSTK